MAKAQKEEDEGKRFAPFSFKNLHKIHSFSPNLRFSGSSYKALQNGNEKEVILDCNLGNFC